MTTENKPKTAEERLAGLENAMGQLIGVLDKQGKILEAVGTKAGAAPAKRKLFGEHKGRKAVLDTVTNITYPSQAALTKGIGGTKGFESVIPTNHFGCYAIYALAPGRFKILEGAEAETAWKTANDKIAAEVAAANAAIAADAKKAEEDKAAAAALEAAKAKINTGKNNQSKK